MNTRSFSRRRAARWMALPTVLFLAVGVGACSARPAGPESVAQDFLSSFGERNLDDAANLTDRPDAAGVVLNDTWDALQAESMNAETTSVRMDGDTATVGYTYRWQLPKDRVWTYDGELKMGRKDGSWSVRWSSTDVHPRLGDKQTMVLRSIAAPKARVNEHSGTDVLVPGIVYRVKFDRSKSGDVIASANALASTLARFDSSLTGQSIAESSTAVKGDYLVTRLRSENYEQVQAQLDSIAGVSISDEADLVSTDPEFAPDLLGQIKKTIIDEVDGKAGWRVVTVNQNGVDTDVLTETAPQPVPSFSISLDRNIQIAAQRAVNLRQDQAMMVVIEPSTGAILAVAQNPAADRDGPVATTGLYPPGSTFKMVTAGAAISTGQATPDTLVPCPGRIVIGERSVPNYNEFSLGTVPMATAFARSCNTSFAKLASEMQENTLTDAAAQFGIGPDYTVVGLPTDSGSVPPASDLVQRTEDGFGQGLVVVSPFGMAMAAATVAHGSTPVPQLISGRETTVDGAGSAITPAMVEGLRSMMRLVVTSGTADRIEDQGEVYGKTGEAEVDGGSHAWFVGYRGDLAFATLVVRGGSSDNAVAVTRDMLTALPEGY
ncbi:cell division protein FtsI/penicillin-binding protein 2 [Rhodococcus sp. 27YEA15]|uniref:penicillin-binding transpeptidase domain-containing protein n=1 Tax=Rhodococcus sp. 27YEA15 TaxID=3156259 RepID=UPI003C7CA4CD